MSHRKRDYQYRDENKNDKAALRKLARKRANDFYYGPNGIMRENEPDPKTYSPTIRRIEEAYAKYKASEGSKNGPQISQPGDKHEQEADLVAKKVTEDDVNINVGDITSSSTPVQPKHEEVLRQSSGLMAKDDDGSLHGTEQLQSQLDSSKGSGQSLDDSTKAEMESKMGADLSDVKIHTGSKANEMSEGINAKAFTYGQDIYFKDGNYSPDTKDGKELLAHELAHTQQQKEGVERKIQRTVIHPSQREDDYFVQLNPPQKGMVEKEEKLLENTDSANGSTIQANTLLALLYESTDKAWYYAETTTGTCGYIQQSLIKSSAELAEQNNEPQVNEIPIENQVTNTNTNTNQANTGTGNQNTNTQNTGNTGNTGNVTNQSVVTQSGIPYANPNENLLNPFSFEQQNTEVNPLINENVIQPPVIDIQAELAKLRETAEAKKQEATQVINKQISQIKASAASERAKVEKTAAEKKEGITLSYDNTILSIRLEVILAYSRTYTAYEQQKQRINDQKTIQLANLENGTNEKVKKMETEGERIAKAAEQHGIDEEYRLNKQRLQIQVNLDTLIEEEIARYNVPDREKRMRDRLGALRDEAMITIGDSNTELIEEIKEDTADLAESIRDGYEDAAEILPADKDMIADSIESMAEDALEQLDGILLTPLEEMKKNAEELVAHLETEKQTVLDHVENVRTGTVQDINTEEAKRIQELRTELQSFNNGVSKIVTDVEAEVQELPDALAAELISKASQQITDSHGKLVKDVKKGTANLKTVFAQLAADSIENINGAEQKAVTENNALRDAFRTQAEELTNALVQAYTDIGNESSKSMSSEVTEYMAQLDKTVTESIAAWEKELAEGKKAITGKVDEVITKNSEVESECMQEIKDEAEQLATEYEITYWARRAWEGFTTFLLMLWDFVVWALKWIGIIILTLIGLRLVYLLLRWLVPIIINLIRRYLPVLYNWVRKMIMRYVWPALKRLGAWIARQFKKKIMKWILKALGLYILGEALMKIWKGISRDDLPMSERREQGREGIFLAATTIIAEWNMIKNLFRLGKGYQEFKKIAELLGNAKLASRLVNLAKGDLALAMELAQMMKPSQLESILPFVDDAIELKNTLGLLGNDVLKLESMLVKCTNLTELNKIISMAGGDALLAERLLVQVGEGKKLIALLQRVPDAKKLSQLLEITPEVGKLSDEALEGIVSMSETDLATLAGKSITEIEAAGVSFPKGIQADPKGVYGYVPKPGSRYSNPQYDFTNPDFVAKNREIRIKYLEETKEIEAAIQEMQALKKSPKEIAEFVVEQRNLQKVKARKLMSPDEVKILEEGNIKKYGHPVGPTPEWLYKQYGSWEAVIEKSLEKDPSINKLLGL